MDLNTKQRIASSIREKFAAESKPYTPPKAPYPGSRLPSVQAMHSANTGKTEFPKKHPFEKFPMLMRGGKIPDPTLAQVTYMPKQLQNSQVKAPNNTLKWLGDLAWNTFGSPPPRVMQGSNWIHPTVGKRGILQNAQLLANNDLATIPRYIGGPTTTVQMLQNLLPYAQQYGPGLLGQQNWAQLQGLLGV